MTSLRMIEAAAERLAGRARRTPLLGSPFVDELAGRRVLVKLECLQHTGNFKFRGAWSALSALDPETRAAWRAPGARSGRDETLARDRAAGGVALPGRPRAALTR
jgi:threonine dehydratase